MEPMRWYVSLRLSNSKKKKQQRDKYAGENFYEKMCNTFLFVQMNEVREMRKKSSSRHQTNNLKKCVYVTLQVLCKYTRKRRWNWNINKKNWMISDNVLKTVPMRYLIACFIFCCLHSSHFQTFWSTYIWQSVWAAIPRVYLI